MCTFFSFAVIQIRYWRMVEWFGVVILRMSGSIYVLPALWTVPPAGRTSEHSRWHCGMITCLISCRIVPAVRKEVSFRAENSSTLYLEITNMKKFRLVAKDARKIWKNNSAQTQNVTRFVLRFDLLVHFLFQTFLAQRKC